MDEIPYIDIHFHSSSLQSVDSKDILRICALTESVLPQMPHSFTAGIHPKDALSFQIQQFQPIWNHPDCIAVGECGMDRRYIQTIPLAKQMEVFRFQAKEAERLHKSLIIHAVRTHDEIRREKKVLEPTVPWILHSFRGNERKTLEMIESGFYLSFGDGLLRDAGNMESFFGKIPCGKLFFETDESGADIRQIYALAASMLGISVQKLRENVYQNFRRVFYGTN